VETDRDGEDFLENQLEGGALPSFATPVAVA
jgi:hypothetical protein